jgi:hypothetical protein
MCAADLTSAVGMRREKPSLVKVERQSEQNREAAQ